MQLPRHSIGISGQVLHFMNWYRGYMSVTRKVHAKLAWGYAGKFNEKSHATRARNVLYALRNLVRGN